MLFCSLCTSLIVIIKWTTALRLYSWACLTPRILCTISVHPRSTKKPVKDTFPFFGPNFLVGDTLGEQLTDGLGLKCLVLFERKKYL
ncbi:hypothetical protein BDQ17DRAFT_1383510, partial [Cyathus striatus]